MKYLLCFVLILALFRGHWSCKTIEELDQCAYDISFLSNRDMKTPSNDADVIDLCNQAKAALKCISDDTKECGKGAVKSITLKVLGDMENHLHLRCDNEKERAEFLKHVQCFSDKAKADAIRLCADKHMVMMEKVVEFPRELRLGGSCCSSHALRECVLNHINNLCPGETGEYFDELIRDVAEENSELVCKEFSDMDRCDAKYDPKTWNDLKAIMASEDKALMEKHKYHTIVPIIAKMLKEIN